MRPFLSMVLLGIYFCITNHHKFSILKQCTLITSQCLHIRNSGIIYLGSLFSNLSQAWNLSTGQGWSPIWTLNWRRFFFQAHLCCCCQDLVPYCCRTEIPCSQLLEAARIFPYVSPSIFKPALAHWILFLFGISLTFHSTTSLRKLCF